jgi:HSP20 family protein
VDIFETRQEITLLADIPGVEANDVEIELNGNSLTVLAKGCDVEGEGARLLSEYSVRSFYRSFSITDVVDTARVSASLIDGVLKIVLPKRDRSIPKRIPISAP